MSFGSKLHLPLKEREHKYLVVDNSWRDLQISQIEIHQGYLCRDPRATIRVRIYDDKGFITVKGITIGDTRDEFEYSIPYEDASAMLKMCQGNVIHKIRHIVPFEGLIWEVDEFLGSLSHLCIAEVELPEGMEKWTEPPFVGCDVTGDKRYYNSNLFDLNNGLDQ